MKKKCGQKNPVSHPVELVEENPLPSQTRTHEAIVLVFFIIPRDRAKRRNIDLLKTAKIQHDGCPRKGKQSASAKQLQSQWSWWSNVVRRTLISHPPESREESPLLTRSRTHVAIVFLFCIIPRWRGENGVYSQTVTVEKDNKALGERSS